MAQEVLDYDQMIWKVFSVGIVYSIILLYSSIEIIDDGLFKTLALTFGFGILLYSSFLVRGYGWKKECLMEVYPDLNLKNRINSELYTRVRLVAEFILIGVIIAYFYYFAIIGGFLIPTFLTLIFIILSVIAHLIR